MDIKIRDIVIIETSPGVTTTGTVMAIHTYPNDMMVVSVKGPNINNWVPATQIKAKA